MKKKTVILLLLMTLVLTVSCGKEKEEMSETDTETVQETGKEDKAGSCHVEDKRGLAPSPVVGDKEIYGNKGQLG